MKGHLIANCRVEGNGKQRADGNDSARCLAISNVSHWGNPLSVLFDTCASYHMCAREECFDRLVKSAVSEVRAGGGEAHAVIGQGAITIQTEFGPVRLHEVLCVPTLKANLCSWPAASRMGAVLSSVGDKTVVSSRNGDVLFQARIVDGLLAVEGILDVHRSPNAVACAVSADMWHKRLGHVNGSTLSSMYKEESVVGMDMTGQVSLDKCDACFEARQSRLPFEETESHAKAPLELVHADVIGKIADKSLGGAHYVLTVLDDYA
jgi:hypothetical protein